MPKLKNQYPKNCRDRNQSFSWYNGKRVYHGVWGSPEAEKNYKRFIARLLENPTLPLLDDKTGDTFVSELAAGFLNYVEIQQDKTEFQHFKRAVGYLDGIVFLAGISCHRRYSSKSANIQKEFPQVGQNLSVLI